LDKGEIVESGTHDELLVNSGLYRKYYDMQFVNVTDVDETIS
jgi:ABC-type multidrug transport system fused ATPase/permease subunit